MPSVWRARSVELVFGATAVVLAVQAAAAIEVGCQETGVAPELAVRHTQA
jgi:hypothetical protein